MTLPPLYLPQLQKVLTEAPTNEALYDILSLYEDEVCQQFTPSTINGDTELLSAFYSSLLFSLLLINEIQEARALTQRIPSTLKTSDSTIQRSISVLRSIYQNRYAETYALLRGQPWPEPVSVIVNKFDSHYSENSFRNISRIYESIRPEAAAQYLGLDAQSDLISALVQRGWEWDAERELFQPRLREQIARVGVSSQPLDQISRIVSLAGARGN